MATRGGVAAFTDVDVVHEGDVVFMSCAEKAGDEDDVGALLNERWVLGEDIVDFLSD